MSQTSCERYGLLVRMRRLNASDDLSRPNHIDQSAVSPLDTPRRPPKPYRTPPISHASRHAAAFALASRHNRPRR